MVSRSSDPHGPSKDLTNSENRLGKIVSSKSLPTWPRILRHVLPRTFALLLADEEAKRAFNRSPGRFGIQLAECLNPSQPGWAVACRTHSAICASSSSPS